MNNTFAKSVDASRWYNGDEETNKVYISDKSSILLGMPRIRQLRIRKGEVHFHLALKFSSAEVTKTSVKDIWTTIQQLRLLTTDTLLTTETP